MATSAIILMRRGVEFRRKETKRLEKMQTKISAAPITRALLTMLVTARAEQMPSICMVTGLLDQRPSLAICPALPSHSPLLLAAHGPQAAGAALPLCCLALVSIVLIASPRGRAAAG